MEKNIFNIPNISCGHCVAAIKDELNEMEGVSEEIGRDAFRLAAANLPFKTEFVTRQVM